jgi:hypothetical protein
MIYIEDTVYNLVVDLPIAIVTSALARPIPIIAGIVASALSVLSFGQIHRLNNEAAKLLSYEKKIISDLYYRLIRVINPNFETSSSFNRLGFITVNIAVPIFSEAFKASYSQSFFDRHVISRALYVTETFIHPMTQIADVALGLLAATISIVPCLGRCERINDFAIEQLNLILLQAVCHGIRHTINPFQ